MLREDSSPFHPPVPAGSGPVCAGVRAVTERIRSCPGFVPLAGLCVWGLGSVFRNEEFEPRPAVPVAAGELSGSVPPKGRYLGRRPSVRSLLRRPAPAVE